MKTLRPGPLSRGPFLPTPLQAGAAAVADDTADDWWAQQSFGLAARASAAAGLTLASSLCAGLQQQADEVVPWLPSEVSSYGPIAQRAQHTTSFRRWESVDELPPVTPTLEDEVAPAAGARPLSAAALLWQVEDELPTAVTVALEDGEWVVPVLALRVLPPQLWQVDDERLPTPDDGYWWRSEAATLAAPYRLASSEDGELPPTLVALEDDSWRAPLAPPVVVVRLVPAHDDEIAQSAATLQVEDAGWAAELPAAPLAVRYVWSATDEVVTPPPALEDGHWAPLLPLPVSYAKMMWAEGDVVVQAPAPQVEDVYWLALASAPGRLYTNYLISEGELVPSVSVLESLARTYVVRAEQRGYVVVAEQRQTSVSAEQRTLAIDSQQRSTP